MKFFRYLALPVVIVVILGLLRGVEAASFVLLALLAGIGLNRLSRSVSLGERATQEIVKKSGRAAQTTISLITCGSVMVLLTSCAFLFFRFDGVVVASYGIAVFFYIVSLSVFEETENKELAEELANRIVQIFDVPSIVERHPWYMPCMASIMTRSDLFLSDPRSARDILIEQMGELAVEMSDYLRYELSQIPISDRRWISLRAAQTDIYTTKKIERIAGIEDLGKELTQMFSDVHERWTGMPLTEDLIGVKLNDDWR